MTRPSSRYRISLAGILVLVAIAAILFAYLSREHTVEWEQIDATFVDVDQRVIDDPRKAHDAGYLGAVRVHRVGRYGAAYAAGVREGDLLLSAHGWPFDRTDSITKAKATIPELVQSNPIKFYGSRRGKLYSGYLRP